MAKVPTLKTNRLRLRAHKPEDLDHCAEMWADPAVVKYIGGRPFSREEVWARLLRYAGHWAWLGYGFWLIEDRQSGRFVGEVGLADFKRDIEPPIKDSLEAGWALSSHSHGQGYGTEALQAVIAWHQARLLPQGLSCLIHPDNMPSLKLAEKCGFSESRRAYYKGQMTAVLVKR